MVSPKAPEIQSASPGAKDFVAGTPEPSSQKPGNSPEPSGYSVQSFYVKNSSARPPAVNVWIETE